MALGRIQPLAQTTDHRKGLFMCAGGGGFIHSLNIGFFLLFSTLLLLSTVRNNNNKLIFF